MAEKIYIPLTWDEAVRRLLRVKPTADMPRPGANPSTRKSAKRTLKKKGARKGAR